MVTVYFNQFMGIVAGAIFGAWIYRSYAMRILHRFRDAGVVSSDKAVFREELGYNSSFNSWIIDQFIKQGALIKTRKNRVYFNQLGYEEYAKNVKKSMISGLIILTIMFFLGKILSK
jgi:hypothetical protein